MECEDLKVQPYTRTVRVRARDETLTGGNASHTHACVCAQELPAGLPVKTRLPPELFGDALMVLEFLQAFGELFDLKDEFPEGITLGQCFSNSLPGPPCVRWFSFQPQKQLNFLN